MTSKDETIYIKEETFNLKMNSLEKRFDKLENLIETEIRLNNQAHEHLQTSIYWGFAIPTLTIAVVIAIVGFLLLLLRLYVKIPREKSRNTRQLSRFKAL